MKITLTLDFPETKTRSDTQKLCRQVIEAGRIHSLIDVVICNFTFDKTK